MFLSNDEIIKVMLEYIEEDKYKSAILINGEWGSGKTFFITEKLSKVIKNKIKNDGKYIYVSLYGVENVEELSNKLYSEICSETLVKLSGVEKEKIDTGIKWIPKLLYFTKFIPFIKNYNSIKKIMAPIIKEIAKIKKCVVVFDDIERCKIDEEVEANEKLSFNRLYGNWWKLEDEEVNDNFRLLKEELKENKYPPILYKNIIIILLQLEIEEFIDENETLEFIRLMKKNLELEETKRKYEKSYKHEIFEILIEDSKTREKYNNLIKDLLDTIDKNLQKEDGKSFLVENEWNEEFLSECSKLSNVFLMNKKFLFYENIEELMTKIVGVKSPYNVYYLIEGIRKIYSFSNVNEYYKNDIPNLELLITKLKIQIVETQKFSKTRTIVLKELHKKLEDYLNKIKK